MAMTMLKQCVKRAFHLGGINVEWRDRVEESIPANYNRSRFLPRLYRGQLYRWMEWHTQLERIRNVEGDIVECGVSIGHGALAFLLLSEFIGVERHYYGFDSFLGHPVSTKDDEITPVVTGKGYYANPPETVLRVLKDGGISDEFVASHVHLVKGWFDETLPAYGGRIALLHLDCDLYRSYKVALDCLYNRVARGGIIMMSQYQSARWRGPTKAVDEFFRDKTEEICGSERCEWMHFVVKRN